MVTESVNEESLIDKLRGIIREGKQVSKLIFKILSCGKRSLTFAEIIGLASEIVTSNLDELIEESLLMMEKLRLLLPVLSRNRLCLSWESRKMLFRLDTKFEIPNVIVHIFNEFLSTGEWNWRKAVKKYFEEIRSPRREVVLRIIEELIDAAYGGVYINAGMIEENCSKFKIGKESVSALIAELKGGGIISPYIVPGLTKPLNEAEKKLFREAPIYELNRALFLKEKASE